MKEKEIIGLLLAKDHRGMEELLLHYGPLMKYIISPIVSDEQARQECLSAAAMRIWEKISLYKPGLGSWTSWLTAVTRNTALNFVRQTSAENVQELTDEIASPEPTPEEEIIKKEGQAALIRALEELMPGDRKLFYRKYYYLQSTAQIASEMGMSVRAVEGRLYRIRKGLQAKLGGEYHE